MGDREGVFRATAVAAEPPWLCENRCAHWLQSTTLGAEVLVTNVGDKRGLIAGGLGAVPPFGFTYIQPRTVGLSLARAF